MTSINRLTKVPLISDDDLFVIWESDSGRTRSITGLDVRNCLLAKGFNPDAFVSGYIENGHLFLTQQNENVVDVGLIDIPHTIQDLINVNPLEANKFLKVSSDGETIEYQAGSSGSTIGIEDRTTALGEVDTINIDKDLRVSITGSTANISFPGINVFAANGALVKAYVLQFDNPLTIEILDGDVAKISFQLPENIMTTDTEQTVTAKKTFKTLAISEATGLSFEEDGLLSWYFDCTKDEFTLSKANGLTPIQVDSNNNVKLQSGNKSAFSTTSDGVIVYDTNNTNHRIYFGETTNFIESNDSESSKYIALLTNNKLAMKCINDGAVELYHDGVKTLDTWTNTVDSSGITVHGTDNAQINLKGSNPDIPGSVFISTNPDGLIGICQADKNSVFEKVWIDCVRDGQVRLWNNGYSVLETFGTEDNSFNGIDIKATNFAAVRMMASEAGVKGGGYIQSDYEGNLSFNQMSQSYGFEKHFIVGQRDGTVKLHYNGSPVVQTTPNGVTVFGSTANYAQLEVTRGVAGSIVLWDSQLYLGISTPGLTQDNRITFVDAESTLTGTWRGSLLPSDTTIKTNINPVSGLSQLKKLNAITWDWDKPEYFSQDQECIGFSAESYAEVFPESVSDYDPYLNIPDQEDDKKDKKTVEYFNGIKGIAKNITSLKMDALLVSAIQELANKNEQLEKRIAVLERFRKENTV